MKIYKMSNIAEEKESNKMKDFFQIRTQKHIDLVKKYCQKIYDYNPEKFKGLMEQCKSHDASKFEDPEIEPYIYITWQYKCKNDGKEFSVPEEIKQKMNGATLHHVKNNKHHPEYRTEQKTDLINRENRDKPPEQMVDATQMPEESIGEMVADWMSMSEEKNSNPKDWADKNVNIRWKFSEKQKKLIYELIDEIWGR